MGVIYRKKMKVFMLFVIKKKNELILLKQRIEFFVKDLINIINENGWKMYCVVLLM